MHGGQMSNNCWLPKCEYYDSSQPWIDYEDFLYSIFRTDFIDSHPEFEGKDVRIRFHPIEYNKEEAFYHVTCQDYLKDGERVPDFRRCERIRWVRAFIENYNCDSSKCTGCDGIKVWEKPYKNNQRIHLLFEEERYIVVLERRDNYVLLITAFYIEQDHTLEKKVKEYHQYKADSE